MLLFTFVKKRKARQIFTNSRKNPLRTTQTTKGAHLFYTLPDRNLIKAHTADLFAPFLSLFNRDHPILRLIDFIAHQHDGHIPQTVLIRAAQPFPSLVVIY